MKNRIIIIAILISIILPMFNFANAITLDLNGENYNLDVFDSYIENAKYYYITDTFLNGVLTHVTLYYIPNDYDYEIARCEVTDFNDSIKQIKCYDKDGNSVLGKYCYYNFSENKFYPCKNINTDMNSNISNTESMTNHVLSSTFNMYNADGTLYFGDDTIGDPSSNLQLSYEYNEDYTSCHIDATIKGGAFTDKIYYSNYQPGITGELLTKRGFPKERYRYY